MQLKKITYELNTLIEASLESKNMDPKLKNAKRAWSININDFAP